MSSLDFDFDFDFDAQMSHLEAQWRRAYAMSMVARADYQALAASPESGADLLDSAREQLDRTEALKVRIMNRLERLEDALLGQE